MAHSDPVLVEAIAERLVAELQAYQCLLEDLRAAGWGPHAAAALQDCADRVQRCAERLPRTSVPLAGFLITRMDLARRMVGSDEGRSEELARMHAEHLASTCTLLRAAQQLQASAGRKGRGVNR